MDEGTWHCLPSEKFKANDGNENEMTDLVFLSSFWTGTGWLFLVEIPQTSLFVFVLLRIDLFCSTRNEVELSFFSLLYFFPFHILFQHHDIFRFL